MADTEKWFVISTLPSHENKVAERIQLIAKSPQMQDIILDVQVPYEIIEKNPSKSTEDLSDEAEEFEDEDEEAEVSNKKKRNKSKEAKEERRLLLPGYVFIKINCIYKSEGSSDDYNTEEELAIPDYAWSVIRHTTGVMGYVGPGGKATPISDEEAERFKLVQKRIEVDYKVGDLVNILSGPFEGFSGKVDTIDIQKGIVTVMISMLGRETPVELVGLDQVKTVD